MPTYKLIYFNALGRAELSRLLFALAGQEFEDVRVTKEQWMEMKPTTIGGQLPVLEIDGKQFCQSIAMASYLAREFGFFGKSHLEALQIEEIFGLLEDLRRHAIKILMGTDEEKEAARRDFMEKHAPGILKAFKTRLGESQSNYFVGSSVTLADLAFYDFFVQAKRLCPDVLDGYPELKAHEDRIGNLDKIKEHVDKREATRF